MNYNRKEMANKSSRSNSGEGRDQPAHRRVEEVTKEDILKNSGEFKSTDESREGRQENLSNRGYEEDQPGEPVRSSGSLAAEDQQQPAGEPDETDENNSVNTKNDNHGK